MKKLLIILPILLMSGFAAAEAQSGVSLDEYSQMVSPCRYWQSVSGGGSVCSSIAYNVQIPEVRDLDYKFRQLEDRIKRLEDQLAQKNK